MIGNAAPGVYIRHVETPSISPVRTDVAGFVGVAERGPLFQPVRLESWTDYRARFGGYIDQGFLAYALDGFFANGGRACYVVRVAGPSAARAWCTIPDDHGQTALLLRASTPGDWGLQVMVTVISLGDSRFSLTVEAPNNSVEFWRNLTLDTAAEVINPVRGGSLLIEIDAAAQAHSAGAPRPGRYRLSNGGADGLGDVGHDEFAKGLDTLVEIDEVALLAIPDLGFVLDERTYLPPPDPRCSDLTLPAVAVRVQPADAPQRPELKPEEVTDLMSRLVMQCEARRDRVAILDPLAPGLAPMEVIAQRQQFDSTYAALYYPWLRVPDLRSGLAPGALRDVPPCGHVAGIYARLEWAAGVTKPPANAVIERANDVTRIADDVTHGFLNQHQVNLLRVYPGRGLRVGGARLLSSDPDWMFINVRRLLIFMERSLNRTMQWSVFEPSNPVLWLEIERSVRTFVDSLWRQGMLDGESAEHAYRVTCDATTNPPDQTDQGRVTCEIRVLPPGCIEQVVVTLVRTDTGAALVQEARS